MNAGFDDNELKFTAVNVESNKQSNDPPPKQAERVEELWLESETVASVHAHSSSVTRATCFEQVHRPSLDAYDGLEPEDVATADGVEVILDTLAEAFQGEHETELFDALKDTFYGPGRKKG